MKFELIFSTSRLLGSNQRHYDLQSYALPTELSRDFYLRVGGFLMFKFNVQI